jgi:hypothetical protein
VTERFHEGGHEVMVLTTNSVPGWTTLGAPAGGIAATETWLRRTAAPGTAAPVQ